MEIYIKRPLLLHTKYVTVQHTITTGNLKIAGTRKTNSSWRVIYDQNLICKYNVMHWLSKNTLIQ